MPKFLSRLLTPPTAADPELARLARQLHRLLLMGIPIAFSFIGFDAEIRAGTPQWSDLIAASSGSVMLILLILLYRGYVRVVSILLILNALGAVTMASFNNLGLRNPAMLVTPLLLMLCSILLDGRITTLFALVTGGMATLLYFNEQWGVTYPQPTVLDSDYLIITLIVITMTTVILHFTINQIIQGAQQIRQQAVELQDKNRRLEQFQTTLEARTQQLSKLNAELQLKVSERARTEAVLRQKQKLESIGLLAGGVAHDFNNLLTSILNQSDLALRRLADAQKARQHIEKAIYSTQRAADLTRQLLAYAGKARFQIEPIDLNQLVQANNGLLETVIQRNSHLQLFLQPQLPTIASDRGQLQQVLMNLVINASEAIRHEYGQIVIKTATVTLTDPVDPTTFVGDAPNLGDYVCLEVSDNGAGMDQAALEKIFDPFFSTKERGHGLGLSVVLGVVQGLQGGLQVHSRPNLGSTFSVYLPASREASLAGEPTAPATTHLPAGQLVLVIDDEEPVRDAVAEMLHTVGYRTTVAVDGYEGLALFDQHRGEISTVLLDMVMPGMNGLETLQKLRAVDTTVKVILSSGYSEVALPDAVLQQPATRFLPKPYTLEQLLKVMVTAG